MRRWRRYQQGPWVFLIALAVSSIVHVLGGMQLRPWLTALLAGGASEVANREEPVKVVRLSPQAFENSLAKARKFANRVRVEKVPAKKKPEPKQDDKVRGQVVRVPANGKTPTKAKYLADKDSAVEKETRARETDPSLNRITNRLQRAKEPSAKGNSPQPQRQVRASQQGRGQSDQAGRGRSDANRRRAELARREPRRRPKTPDILLPQDGTQPIRQDRRPAPTLPPSPTGTPGGKDEKTTEAGGRPTSGTQQGVPTLDQLRPTLGTIARISGTPDDDYIENVPDGDGTFLNTKSFKYATYYYRIRDGVAHHWRRSVREFFRRDPTGTLYGTRDLRTVLFIQLDDDGRVDDVRVKQSCGYPGVDNLAVTAFRKAERFPNPPKGMIDEKGRVTFDYGFVLVRSRRGPLNLFR